MKKLLGSSPPDAAKVSTDAKVQEGAGEDGAIRNYLREYTRTVLADEVANQSAMGLQRVTAGDVERARQRAGALQDYWDQLADAVSAEGLLLHQQRQVEYLEQRVQQLERLDELRHREAELRALLFPAQPAVDNDGKFAPPSEDV